MKFVFDHNNINVVDLDRAISFYKDALGLMEKRRKTASDGAFVIVFMTDDVSSYELELTWLRDFDKERYDLGDEEFHLAFRVDDFEAAHALHEKMGCIVYENPNMGVYFIQDPDGYWVEILGKKKPTTEGR